MKIGLNVKIDVTKIDKSRIFEGKKGKYIDLTTFFDTNEKDQYENNGFISQATTKEEREQGVQTPILGNVKVFYTDGNDFEGEVPANAAPSVPSDFEDDIPFMNPYKYMYYMV